MKKESVLPIIGLMTLNNSISDRERPGNHPWPSFFIHFYLMPNSLPNLFLLPCLVVGIPVALATFCFADVIPNARFQLNERPGINDFFAIAKHHLLKDAFILEPNMIKNNLLIKNQRNELIGNAHFGCSVKQRREDQMAFPFLTYSVLRTFLPL